MKQYLVTTAVWASLMGAASAQDASISVGPDGTLRGSASAPGAPPVNIQAGNGSVSAGPAGASSRSGAYAGPGRSVTVRSPDGSASSSVSVTGDNAAVAGSGSPGSRITVSPPAPKAQPRLCPPDVTRAYRLRTGCRLAPAARLR